MGIWLAIVAVVCYLFFFIDGREFTGVMREGGWATVAFYCLIGVFIVVGLSYAPETVQQGAATGVHH
ncbi:MAG TPA: hypothetical protein VJ882_03965 [Desulfuromonadales bacterium]|nr:hypothetical protein [Desulfuromonadales bacterium]